MVLAAYLGRGRFAVPKDALQLNVAAVQLNVAAVQLDVGALQLDVAAPHLDTAALERVEAGRACSAAGQWDACGTSRRPAG